MYRDIDPGLRRYRQQSKAGSVSHAGLQRFSTLPQALVSVIPNSLDFQEAATLPLSITLAAVGLYQKNHLNLPLPRVRSEETRGDDEAEHTVLVINGASEIGSLAIQLATASGVRVIATASQTDAKYVRSLGASVVVDEPGASLAGALRTDTVQLSGIFDTRSTEESFAQIDALLQDIAQSPRVCAVNPPAHPPRSFVPTVGEFSYRCSERIPSLSLTDRICFFLLSSHLLHNQQDSLRSHPLCSLGRIPPCGSGEWAAACQVEEDCDWPHTKWYFGSERIFGATTGRQRCYFVLRLSAEFG